MMAKTHLDDSLAFTDNIAGGAYGNKILMLGRPLRVQILQHGFYCSTEAATWTICLFVNQLDCS